MEIKRFWTQHLILRHFKLALVDSLSLHVPLLLPPEAHEQWAPEWPRRRRVSLDNIFLSDGLESLLIMVVFRWRSVVHGEQRRDDEGA